MHNHVFLGGTFDRMHKGHRSIIDRAFAEGKEVTIGLTSDEFVKKHKKNAPEVRSFEERKKNLQEYLVSKSFDSQAVIKQIDDPYEPAASGFYDALLVTPDNKQTGKEINNLRRSRTLDTLALIEVELIAADDGGELSSTRVRSGEVDREGHFHMPEDMREILGKPMGRLLKSDEEIVASIRSYSDRDILTVGDIATQRVLSQGLHPLLAIIDLYVQRKPHASIESYSFEDAEMHHIKSGPSFISVAARDLIKSWALKPRRMVIVVDGEEDLLALPAIANAPHGGVVYYGQPNEGLVEVSSTDEHKSYVLSLLRRFEQ